MLLPCATIQAVRKLLLQIILKLVKSAASKVITVYYTHNSSNVSHQCCRKITYFMALQSKLVLQTKIWVHGSNSGHVPFSYTVEKQQLLFRSHARKHGCTHPPLWLSFFFIMQSRDLRVSPLESRISQNVFKKLITWPQCDLQLSSSVILFFGGEGERTSCFMWL